MFIRVVDSSSKPLNNLLRSLILKADFMDYLSLGGNSIYHTISGLLHLF